MSDRDKKAQRRLHKKFVKQVVNRSGEHVKKWDDEMKLIQDDFDGSFLPITFIIVDHENTYFARPSMTIDELLTSESLKNRIKNECDKVGIDSTLLASASVMPRINGTRTVEEWVKRNAENPFHIVFKYKMEFQQRKDELHMRSVTKISAESGVVGDHVDQLADVMKVVKEQSDRIDQLLKSEQEQKNLNDQQNNRIEQQSDRIHESMGSVEHQNHVIGTQNIQMKTQDAKIASLTKTMHSLCASTKPLVYLHRRILIEKFRLHLVKKYSDLFEQQTGINITKETKYYDVYEHLREFLTALCIGPSSALITSEEEKQCLQQALGRSGSYYQVTSEKFIHDVPKDSIAESVLRSDGSSGKIKINMFVMVYGEEPNLTENSIDMPSVADDEDNDSG